MTKRKIVLMTITALIVLLLFLTYAATPVSARLTETPIGPPISNNCSVYLPILYK